MKWTLSNSLRMHFFSWTMVRLASAAKKQQQQPLVSMHTTCLELIFFKHFTVLQDDQFEEKTRIFFISVGKSDFLCLLPKKFLYNYMRVFQLRMIFKDFF